MSRRETAFTLWRPARTLPVPKVRIVSFVPGNSPSESLVFEGDLALTGDPDGSVGVRANTQNPLRLSTNHRLVIDELPSSWIGRAPLFPWEAKVYTYE
jgi:hypothetical protein